MNYEQHAENGFTDLDRPQLREACKTLGLTIGPNESEASMRAKLCTAMGHAAPAPKEAPKPQLKPVATSIPNLSPDGEWGGKWYYVTITPKNEKFTSCPVGWNGNYRNLPLNEEVRIIAPHFNVLTESKGERIGQRKYKDEDTGVEMYARVSFEFREFIISNWRVDPETAHLPQDYVEFFTKLEEKYPNFETFKKKQLAAIYARLADHIKEQEIAKMSEEDLRDKVLTLIKQGYGADILSLDAA